VFNKSFDIIKILTKNYLLLTYIIKLTYISILYFFINIKSIIMSNYLQ